MSVVEEGYLAVQEAGDACGMAHRTLLAKVRRGELRAEKPDGRPYLRRDVEAFIERSRVEPDALRRLYNPSRAERNH